MKGNRLFGLIKKANDVKDIAANFATFKKIFYAYLKEDAELNGLVRADSFARKELGFHVDETGGDKYKTLLEYAIDAERTDLIDFLVAHGANTEKVFSNYTYRSPKLFLHFIKSNACGPEAIRRAGNFEHWLESHVERGLILSAEEINTLKARYKNIMIVANGKVKENPQPYIQAIIKLIPQELNGIYHHDYWCRVLNRALIAIKDVIKALNAIQKTGPNEIAARDQLYLLLGRVYYSKFIQSERSDFGALGDALKAWASISTYQSVSAEESFYIATQLAGLEQPQFQIKTLESAYQSVVAGNSTALILFKALLNKSNQSETKVDAKSSSAVQEVKQDKPKLITAELEDAYKQRLAALRVQLTSKNKSVVAETTRDRSTRLDYTLKYAIQADRLDVIDCLLDEKADTCYAFHTAIANPKSFLYLITKLGNQALFAAINTVDKRIDDGQTLFYSLANKAQPEIMIALLRLEFSAALDIAIADSPRCKGEGLILGTIAILLTSTTALRCFAYNYHPAMVKKLFNVCSPLAIQKASNDSFGYFAEDLWKSPTLRKEYDSLKKSYDFIEIVANEKINKEYVQAVIALIPDDYREICHHDYWCKVLMKAIKASGLEVLSDRDKLYQLLGRVCYSKYVLSNCSDHAALVNAQKAWSYATSYHGDETTEPQASAEELGKTVIARYYAIPSDSPLHVGSSAIVVQGEKNESAADQLRCVR